MYTMLWTLRRTLGLSPTQKIMREIRRRGVPVHELGALELFAHCGFLQTRDLLQYVASLEAWEIDPSQEEALRRNLPGAEVKITNSYAEIQRTPKKYGLILMDAPDLVHGDNGQYCEHFNMFPEVFRVAMDSAVLIMNVMPGYPDGKPRGRVLFTEAHLERRRQFYGTEHPETLAFDAMIPVYRKLIQEHGYALEWYFTRRRTRDGRLHYLVLKVQRRPAVVPAGVEARVSADGVA
jgi:hypothetical protein